MSARLCVLQPMVVFYNGRVWHTHIVAVSLSHSLLLCFRAAVAIGDPHIALAAALRIFRPARFSLTLSSDYAGKDIDCFSGVLSSLPEGYVCCAAQLCDLPGGTGGSSGGHLSYYTFVETASVTALSGAAAAVDGVDTVLSPFKLLASGGSLRSVQSFCFADGSDDGLSAAGALCRCCSRAGGSSGSDVTMAGVESEEIVCSSSEGGEL